MKGGKNPFGYTIVEVMIVLAVSGVMFVIAANFISGKQARTAFTTGSHEFNSQVQTVISQVTSGQYSDINYKCSHGTPPSITGGSQQQGSNSDCIFIGKVLQFSASNTAKYDVFSLTTNRDATDFSNTTPIISSDGSNIDLTTHNVIPQGLDIYKVTITPTAGGSVVTSTSSGLAIDKVVVGFIQSLGAGVGADGYQNGNGAQAIGLYYASATGPVGAGDRLSLQPATAAVICVGDGTRYANIQLGDSNGGASQLSANLQVVASC